MDDKKERLTSAAHSLFLKNGYKNTNIAQIAKKAGVAVGSFYNYYASKEDIFLAVYIEENETMRSHLIQQIDWKGDAEQIIDELFSYSFKNIMNNKILIEWNNGAVSQMLHSYYYSKTGIKNNSFHHFLQKIFTKWMRERSLTSDAIEKILKVFDFIYYIDCHVTGDEFTGYGEALQTFVKYFVKGILSEVSSNT